jgi:hypothetical protein
LEVNGTIRSQNAYDVVVATEDWANEMPGGKAAVLKDASMLSGVSPGISLPTVASLSDATNAGVLVVDAKRSLSGPKDMQDLREYIKNGGKVLLLHPGPLLKEMFPEQVKGFTAKEGEIVMMHVPESPVFSGISPLDLAWFERGGRRVPIACTGVYQIAAAQNDIAALAWQCDIHGYLQSTADVTKISGSPLVDIHLGKGRVLASEMCFEAGRDDPIARRLFSNALAALDQDQH